MRIIVEHELDRLVSDGILETVQFADWASPIVPVLKADGHSVRICGDFKLLNQACKLDKYPLPKIEDLFVCVAGGKAFTKLDLSQAYQQVSLAEESRKYVVINTHRGLFRYNGMPFGVSSAPGVFQRVMENLLKDIPKVVVYLDDILGNLRRSFAETSRSRSISNERNVLSLCLQLPIWDLESIHKGYIQL